jgi:hypothetical protein
MQEHKAQFKTQAYGNDNDFMLIRLQERNKKSNGLPPTVSQCIMMNENEIEELISCLLRMKSRNSVS